VVEAIRERVSLAQALTRAQIEWQTKILAGFISSTVQSPKAAKELHQAVQTLTMMPGEDDADSSLPAPTAEPRVGSFEKLAGLFGGGMGR
jgi:hypothetical protein